MIVVKNINNNVSLCLDSSNLQMYETMRQEYKAVADCVDKIGEYYESVTSAELNEEEKLYLILHINRVCSKESEGKGLLSRQDGSLTFPGDKGHMPVDMSFAFGEGLFVSNAMKN